MYVTVEQVRERTSFSEIAALSGEKIQMYIERATAWIHRETKRTYENETNPSVLIDVRTASVLLAEYIWYQDNPDVKEENLSPVETEKIGSYSYTMRDVQTVDSIKEREYEGTHTGIKELDLILEGLKPDPVTAVCYFGVYGPSRVNR